MYNFTVMHVKFYLFSTTMFTFPPLDGDRCMRNTKDGDACLQRKFSLLLFSLRI